MRITGSSEVIWTQDSAWADLIQRLETELEEKVLRYRLTLRDRPQLEWSWQKESSRGGMECTILAHIDSGSNALSVQNKRHLHWKALDSTQGMSNEMDFSAHAHNLLMKAEATISEHQEIKNRSASIQALPQAARKKRYTKLNLNFMDPPRVDNDGHGRAQYVSLQSPEGGTLTIINVYAQRSSNDRAPLWRSITQADFTADHVVVGGDFNHLEETTRRGVFGERQIHRREAASWHQMTLRYGLADAWKLDSFRKMSKKNFTFDNGRSGAFSAVSRIDKFLVSQDIEERRGRIEAAASIRKLSDHSPLIITFWGLHPPITNPSRFFDATLLSEEDHKTELLNAWSGDSSHPTNGRDWAEWLEAAMKTVNQCNARLAKEKRRAHGTRVRTCAKKI
ncbi:unnamed protein product [Sphagnum compactum]